MTAPDDLIRRGDVLAIVFPDACSEARKGALCLHPSCDDVRYSPILDALRALPADPVAEAAVRFAEVIDRTQRQLVTGKPIRLYGLSGPEGQAALDAYRAAVAARAKETR